MKKTAKQKKSTYTCIIGEDKCAITHNNRIYVLPKDTFEMFLRKSYKLVENLTEEYITLMKLKPITLNYETTAILTEPS